jgi:hypothetical protein
MAARRWARRVCVTKASSYLSRSAALVFCPKLSGRWIQRRAWATSMRSSVSRTVGGSTSGTSVTRSSAVAMVSSSCQVFTAAAEE